MSIQEQIIASTSNYIWQDDEDTDFAVDAENLSSCYARYANVFLCALFWNAKLTRDGDQIWLVATRDISPGEEIYMAYGDHYWKGFQDLSYDKALMTQRCYNMEAVPPYNPYAQSTAQPP
jgi:SET domain